MDAVYLVGPGRSGGDPLRYSMRSVEANLPMVTRVVTVGYRWRWLTDEVLHIDVPQDGPKHHNTYRNLRAALADDRISDQFVLMNDDFFVVARVDEIPPVHRGPIDEHIVAYERTQNTRLLRRRLLLRRMLLELGVERPLDYELHIPMVIDRATAVEVFDLADKVRPPGMEPTGKRTLYGNLARIGGTPAADVKIRGARDPMPPGAWWSTSPRSWPGEPGRTIRRMFREPSRWEEH